jgi:hypothetical protein
MTKNNLRSVRKKAIEWPIIDWGVFIAMTAMFAEIKGCKI